jgi:hypothetical protein
MGELKKDAADAFVHKVQALEDRADECYKPLQLLRTPYNLATWALLTWTVIQLESEMARWGAESAHFQAALLNLGRVCPSVGRWLAKHGKPESRLIRKYRWTERLKLATDQAVRTGLQYAYFEGSFPMWHRNALLAGLPANNLIRFTVPGGAREKQVSAYHKGFRPSRGRFLGNPAAGIPQIPLLATSRCPQWRCICPI